MMIDSRKVEDLHPTLQRGFYELQRRMKAAGYDMQTNSTFRDYARQDALYAQGRTAPGGIVTNAKAGYSNHNFRIAFDIYENIKGKEWDNKVFFAKAGAIWKEMGGVWGGDFSSFPDTPHFEYTNGLTTAQLRAGQTLKADAKMKWETAGSAPTATAPATQSANKTADVPNGVGSVFSTEIKAGAKVNVKPGAVYGGLTSTRGKAVPNSVYGLDLRTNKPARYTVSLTARHNGVDEALLKEITSWVALKDLALA